MQSKVGRGSTFWVELPLGIGNEAVTTQFPPHPDVSRGYNHFEHLHGQPVIQKEAAKSENAAPRTRKNDTTGKYEENESKSPTTESVMLDYTNEGL